jgi:hypothetical protein
VYSIGVYSHSSVILGRLLQNVIFCSSLSCLKCGRPPCMYTTSLRQLLQHLRNVCSLRRQNRGVCSVRRRGSFINVCWHQNSLSIQTTILFVELIDGFRIIWYWRSTQSFQANLISLCKDACLRKIDQRRLLYSGT